ncbi:hypothetical protein [Allorhizocola rhizosphaerae]|uniref:hypothetical protein n=1 Tax=Allorhizocola rhizosphaerae TaxID=1872709 RepID=UPI000E3C5004|nr:hypothetical protein [Allorhizocola rhizosphaerae]
MRRALILLPPLLAVFFAPSPGHAASFCDGHAYVSLGTQLLRFDPTSGATTPVRGLPNEINAIAAHGDALYAIADPGGRAIKLAADWPPIATAACSRCPRTGRAPHWSPSTRAPDRCHRLPSRRAAR